MRRYQGPRRPPLLTAVVLLGLAPGLAAQEAAEPAAQEAAARTAATRLDDAELDALTARVADQLRCPVCRNQSVLESSSELARRMQSVVRERLAAGESPEEVKGYFVARYGEWILLRPKARGINLVVYLLPAVLLLGGGLLVRGRLRAWRAARAEVPEGPPGGPEEVRAERGARGGEEDGIENLGERDRAWLNDAIRSG